MAITREEFFNKKANASLWDVAVSIKRGNPLPLDADSIFDSYAALETYAADVLAYPGQLVAVVEESSTNIYYLDQNLAIKPVGIVPSGDSKSVEVTADGIISLLGAKTAPNGTLPMIGEDGVLTWKTLEDIGAGDGNDNTTYEITALEKGEGEAAETYGIKIQVIENGIASGDPIEIPFDVYTKVETDNLLDGIKTRLGALEAKEDKDTTYSVAEGEKVLKLNGTAFSTEIGLKHEGGKISLTGINGEVIAEFSDADFIKDSVLEDVEYNAETKEIEFTWKTVDGETKTDAVSVADFVQIYTAGNGLEANGNEFSVKVDSESEAFLSVGENGIKLSGVQEALNTVASNAADDAAGKAAQALADAKADAADLYATKAYVGTIPDSYSETNVISYINKKAEETLAAAQGGSSETAASVKQQLDNYKSENDTKVNANTQAIENINDKLKDVESNAEVNIIEVVKVNGSALSVSAEDRSVDITVPTALNQLGGYTAIDERITAAKAQADKGVEEAGKANAAAATNAEEIGKHETRLGLVETAKTNHEERILTLENAKDSHKAEYNSLKGTVDGHTEAIAKKAEQTALDAVSAKASTNESAIQTINETTIPGVLTEVNKKANAADVYTKTEIGTITEGKTIVGMIAEAQSAATYDDNEIRGLIASETDRATAAEGALSVRIAKAETFLNEANLDSEDGSNNVIDTLKEIQEYIIKDETGAAGMLANIQSNTTAIEAINNETTGIFAQAKTYVENKFDALPSSGPIAGALLGLVKSSEEDNKIKVETDGTMSVNRISTDKLYVPENSELILNGGSATDWMEQAEELSLDNSSLDNTVLG